MLDGWMNAFSTEMNDVDDSTHMKSTRFMFRLDLSLLPFCLCVRVFMPFSFSLIFRRRPSTRLTEKKIDKSLETEIETLGKLIDLMLGINAPSPHFAVYCVNTPGSPKKTFIFLSLSIQRPHFVCPRVFVFERFDRRHMPNMYKAGPGMECCSAASNVIKKMNCLGYNHVCACILSRSSSFISRNCLWSVSSFRFRFLRMP